MNTNKLTPAQLKCISTICQTKKISKDVKANIVSGFTNGRTETSTELTPAEATEVIRHLKEAYGDGDTKSMAAMIGKLFYYCHEMNWTKLNPKGKIVADGKKLDEWMVEYSYLKKKMNAYTYQQLPKLVSQFSEVYKSHLKKQQ